MTIDQLNNSLGYHLIVAKELAVEITDRFSNGVQIDLTCAITLVQNLINTNIQLKAVLEKLSDNQKETDAILSEIIDHYYTSLRILKRHNKRDNIPTSEIAIASCKHSSGTLQAVINTRRWK